MLSMSSLDLRVANCCFPRNQQFATHRNEIDKWMANRQAASVNTYYQPLEMYK